MQKNRGGMNVFCYFWLFFSFCKETKEGEIFITVEVKTDEVKTVEVKTDEARTVEVKTDEVKTDEVKII